MTRAAERAMPEATCSTDETVPTGPVEPAELFGTTGPADPAETEDLGEPAEPGGPTEAAMEEPVEPEPMDDPGEPGELL